MSEPLDDELNLDPEVAKTLAKELHVLTLRELIKKVRSGEATAADLNVARAICKDNNIQSLPTPGSPLKSLADSLPFAGAPSNYQ